MRKEGAKNLQRLLKSSNKELLFEIKQQNYNPEHIYTGDYLYIQRTKENLGALSLEKATHERSWSHLVLVGMVTSDWWVEP